MHRTSIWYRAVSQSHWQGSVLAICASVLHRFEFSYKPHVCLCYISKLTSADTMARPRVSDIVVTVNSSALLTFVCFSGPLSKNHRKKWLSSFAMGAVHHSKWR